MTDRPPPQSWEGLQQRVPRHAAQIASDTPEEMVMRVTSGGEGKKLLDWLHAEFVEKTCAPGASEAELREADAYRRLVKRLERMCEQGAEIARQRRENRA